MLYQQYGQPSLLRSVQRKLSSHVLAHSTVPLVGREAPKYLVMTSSRTCRLLHQRRIIIIIIIIIIPAKATGYVFTDVGLCVCVCVSVCDHDN